MNLEVMGERIFLVFDQMVDRVGRVIMPDKHSERTRTAEIRAIGDKVTFYKPGDKVLLSWYTGIRLHLEGQEINGEPVDEDRFRVVKQEEILAKII
jgi:co-chaperonin GroES (HSP10)